MLGTIRYGTERNFGQNFPLRSVTFPNSEKGTRYVTFLGEHTVRRFSDDVPRVFQQDFYLLFIYCRKWLIKARRVHESIQNWLIWGKEDITKPAMKPELTSEVPLTLMLQIFADSRNLPILCGTFAFWLMAGPHRDW